MDARRLIVNGTKRVKSIASVWWSDVRFYWSIKDKTGIAIFAGFVLFAGIFTVLIQNYIGNKEQRRELYCLALNVYHEARGEPVAGQYAVAEVTLNRVASRHYPNSVCEVVYQRNWDARRKRYVGMFSWTELDEKPGLTTRHWLQSLKIAKTVSQGNYAPTVEGALFYHANYIKPRWARHKRPKAKIGRHIFY